MFYLVRVVSDDGNFERETIIEGRSPSQKGLVPEAVVEWAQDYGAAVWALGANGGRKSRVKLETTVITQVGTNRAKLRHGTWLQPTTVAYIDVDVRVGYYRVPGRFVADVREWWG